MTLATSIRLNIERLTFEGFGPREREQILTVLEARLMELVRSGELIEEPRQKPGRKDASVDVRGSRPDKIGRALAEEVYRRVGPALLRQAERSGLRSDSLTLDQGRKGGDDGSNG